MLTKVSKLKASKRLEIAKFTFECYAEYFAKERENSKTPDVDLIEDCYVHCARKCPFNNKRYASRLEDPKWQYIKTIVYDTITYALFIDFGIRYDFFSGYD
ncbi:MAG: hypothetical protein J6Q15_00390 [Clostridia bacterium]|nr:hypothetical protein [Clostridia bacterium]